MALTKEDIGKKVEIYKKSEYIDLTKSYYELISINNEEGYEIELKPLGNIFISEDGFLTDDEYNKKYPNRKEALTLALELIEKVKKET